MGSWRDRQFSFHKAPQAPHLGKLSIRQVKIWNFTRLGRKTEEKELLKVQKWHCTTSVHGHCIVDKFGQVRTGSDKSEQVWSAIFPQTWVTCSPNLTHPQTCVQVSNRTSLETLRPSEVVKTALCHTSMGVRCEVQLFLGAPPQAIGHWKALD